MILVVCSPVCQIILKINCFYVSWIPIRGLSIISESNATCPVNSSLTSTSGSFSYTHLAIIRDHRIDPIHSQAPPPTSPVPRLPLLPPSRHHNHCDKCNISRTRKFDSYPHAPRMMVFSHFVGRFLRRPPPPSRNVDFRRSSRRIPQHLSQVLTNPLVRFLWRGD